MSMIDVIKNIFEYCKDNLKRPSTWIGFLCLFIGYSIYEDKAIFNRFLGNIVEDSDFAKMFCGLISGFLVGHRSVDVVKTEK